METISISEYGARLLLLAEEIRKSVPDVRVEISRGSLWIQTKNCTGEIGLSFPSTGQFMVSEATVASGTALSGTAEDLKRGIADYQKIHDALVIGTKFFENVHVVST